MVFYTNMCPLIHGFSQATWFDTLTKFIIIIIIRSELTANDGGVKATTGTYLFQH